MAYNYFSRQLVNTDYVDLSNVFPELQSDAKNVLSVSYDLGDIILWLQDSTQNFTRDEIRFVEVDTAIQLIIERYFNAKGQPNPFTTNVVKLTTDEGNVPREPAIVSIQDQKLKSKGVAKAPKITQIEPEPQPQQIIPDDVPEFIIENELESLKASIEAVEDGELEGNDLEETLTFISNQTQFSGVFADEDEAKSWFNKNNFDYNKYIQ